MGSALIPIPPAPPSAVQKEGNGSLILGLALGTIGVGAVLYFLSK